PYFPPLRRAIGGPTRARPPNRRSFLSRSRHVHRHGDTVGDHVEDGRAPLCTFDDLSQLLLRRVALDPERDTDLLEAVAVVVREAECTLQVHVSYERRLNFGTGDGA